MNKQAIIDSNVLVAIALFCKEFAINFIITFDRDFDMIVWLKRIWQPAEVKTMFAEYDQTNQHLS